MPVSRPELGDGLNALRRAFWERCASRPPVDRTAYELENSFHVAKFADDMLKEWDKRWIEK